MYHDITDVPFSQARNDITLPRQLGMIDPSRKFSKSLVAKAFGLQTPELCLDSMLQLSHRHRQIRKLKCDDSG